MRYLLYQLLFFVPSLLLAQTSKPVILHDSTRYLSVGRQVSILKDTTAQLTFTQVSRRTDFAGGQSETFHFGYSRSVYWLRLNLINQSQENTKHWLLGLMDVATLDYVDLYVVYPNGRMVHQTGGLRRPDVDRGFFSITPLFRVELPTQTPVTAYIRLESTLPIFGRVTVWDEYYNLSKGRFNIFAVWTFLGLFILRSLTNFVLARFIPDQQFRFYALCTFLLYVATLSRAGIYPIVFSHYPTLLDWLHYGINRLLPLGLAGWIYTWLDHRALFRPLRWLLIGIMAISIVGTILAFFVQTVTIGQFYAILVLCMYGLFFGSVVLIWVAGLRPPLHFVLPMTVCMIPFFLYQSQLVGLIPYRPVLSLLVLLTLAVEMVSMSLVLGRVVQSYVRDRIATANALMHEKVEVDKLQELDALKTRFFTNISHEFRTPLTLILGPLTNRKQKPLDEPELGMMERNGRRLMTLINQILDLSKLEAGQLLTTPEPGDLAFFFRVQAASFTSLAESRGILFTFVQNEDSYWALFDRDKLEKITSNLLSNAFKFTPMGRAVQMRVAYDNGATQSQPSHRSIVLTIADEGIGIPATDLAHIFDRFYQRPAETPDGQNSWAYESSGVGLALVRELAQVLQGTIEVQSTEGKGTSFRLVLPILTAEPVDHVTDKAVPDASDKPFWSVEPVLSITTPSERSDGKGLLLLIDDNADIRSFVHSIFAADYQILEAEDGQQGIEQATQHAPDLVICDLMMPRLDGFGFCRALKTQDATSHIPVVMLTAKATQQDRIEGFELGADDYLIKPFQADELRARVRNLLLKQERLRQYFGKTVVAVPNTAPPTPSREDVFLQKARQVVEKRLGENTFGVEEFSQLMGLSSSQLLRKLKALTGLTAVEFVRQYRLERAAILLAGRVGTVSEIAWQVGFESLPYFTKIFQERYGVPPSEYTS